MGGGGGGVDDDVGGSCDGWWKDERFSAVNLICMVVFNQHFDA